MSPQDPLTMPRGLSQNDEVPNSTCAGSSASAPATPAARLNSQGRAGSRLAAGLRGMLAAPALLIADH